MSRIFFTSDLHIGHANVINLDGRPFRNVREMDAELIRRWNNKVMADDTVYILGDFIWETREKDAVNIINKLHGKKILIRGNHEKILCSDEVRKLFEEIKDYDYITVKLSDGTKQRCVLSHYFMPFYDGHFRGAVLLHGHSHNSAEHFEELRIAKELNDKGFPNSILNVGCMHWDYEPVTLDEMIEMERREKTWMR